MPGQSRGVRIGRVVGAPIIVSGSAWMLILLGVLIFAPTVTAYLHPGVAMVGLILAFAVLLAGSVLLHEVAHAVTARARGIDVGEVVITGWGGHTSMDRIDKPATEALVAVAGPLANGVLAIGFWLAFQAGNGLWPLPLTLLVMAGWWSNMVVAVFNLLPGLPLDGGQLVEALVWAVTKDQHKGTFAAGWLGRVIAIGVGLWALVLPLVRGGRPDLFTIAWSFLIISFLWRGATDAMSRARHAQRLDGLDPMQHAHPVVALPITTSVADAERAAAGEGTVVFALDSSGRPVGVYDPASGPDMAESVKAATQLGSVAIRLPDRAAVPASLRGQALAHALGMVARETDWVAVVSDDGRVLGALRVTDIIAALR